MNHSAYMALLDLIEKISTALDNNEYAVAIFLDLSKAFSTVNHEISLSKLYRYGFQGIVFQWLSSYFTDMQQHVYVNNCKSNTVTLSCGVAQGLILGPLLFLIYINNLATVQPPSTVFLHIICRRYKPCSFQQALQNSYKTSIF